MHLPETHPQTHPQPSPAHFWGVLFSIVHGPDDDSSFRFKHPMPPLFVSTDVFPGNNKKTNSHTYLFPSCFFFLSTTVSSKPTPKFRFRIPNTKTNLKKQKK